MNLESTQAVRNGASQRDRTPSVTFVTTPEDGSCGIGTYTRDLKTGFEDVDTASAVLPQDDRSFGAFLSAAIDAVRSEGDVIHVQHEYGLFRRDGSKFPGVWGFLFFPVLFLYASLRSKPVVVTMHSALDQRPDEAPLSVRLSVLGMHKLLARGAAHLVFLSPGCARRFRSHVPLDAANYSVLSHGVKTDVPAESTPALRREFGYQPDDDVVAIPGFIRPPKGHDIFVEVAQQLPEYEFLVVGGARPKGADFEFAEQIRDDAPDNVTITGVLEDGRFWEGLAVPDLALLPYRVVSQSGTFNCCASQGLPVLASDARYFQQIAAEWGTPEIISLDDPADVATRVRTLLEDDTRREQLSESIREYRRANSFDRIGSEHRRIYEQVLGWSHATTAVDPEPTADNATDATSSVAAEQASVTDD